MIYQTNMKLRLPEWEKDLVVFLTIYVHVFR